MAKIYPKTTQLMAWGAIQWLPVSRMVLLFMNLIVYYYTVWILRGLGYFTGKRLVQANRVAIFGSTQFCAETRVAFEYLNYRHRTISNRLIGARSLIRQGSQNRSYGSLRCFEIGNDYLKFGVQGIIAILVFVSILRSKYHDSMQCERCHPDWKRKRTDAYVEAAFILETWEFPSEITDGFRDETVASEFHPIPGREKWEKNGVASK